MKDTLIDLFEGHFGSTPDSMVKLPASGSPRKYYRMYLGDSSYMGVCHMDKAENRLFLDFSRHFRAKGLHAPEIYCVAADGTAYVLEDLGESMLLDVLENERKGKVLTPHLMELYRKSLEELLRFQTLGHEGMDYSACIPRQAFDRRCILWDLNYFKYCFLRLAGATFSEDALEDDFEELAGRLAAADDGYFMFRDFQSRNIMVRDEEVWFIDYQGGRRGALQYDVASLLYDAIAEIPDVQREELLEAYLEMLADRGTADPEAFRRDYYHFVLVRLLQALGAFGLRGLHEGKPHFIASINPGMANVLALFSQDRLDGRYPEICRAVESCRKAGIAGVTGFQAVGR